MSRPFPTTRVKMWQQTPCRFGPEKATGSLRRAGWGNPGRLPGKGGSEQNFEGTNEHVTPEAKWRTWAKGVEGLGGHMSAWKGLQAGGRGRGRAGELMAGGGGHT